MVRWRSKICQSALGASTGRAGAASDVMVVSSATAREVPTRAPVQDVAGEVEVPAAVAVPERVRVDGEPLVRGEVDPGVHEGAERVVGRRDPQVVPGVAVADGVVHPEAAIHLGDLRRPVVGAGPGRQRHQRPTSAGPADQVRRGQDLEDAAVHGGAGPVGHVAAAGAQHEGVGEVAGVHRVAVRARSGVRPGGSSHGSLQEGRRGAADTASTRLVNVVEQIHGSGRAAVQRCKCAPLRLRERTP